MRSSTLVASSGTQAAPSLRPEQCRRGCPDCMFSLTASEQAKLDAWLWSDVYPKIVAAQKQDPSVSGYVVADDSGRVHPYLGAIGGGLTYQFTPTSLGTVIKVIFAHDHPTWEAALDLTTY